jgi:hypothetical protein
MTFSEEQVVALAPDASSIKAGKDLATPSKWGMRGASEKALWGECQGSGRLPYQTQVDLLNLALNARAQAGNFLANTAWLCCYYMCETKMNLKKISNRIG